MAQRAKNHPAPSHNTSHLTMKIELTLRWIARCLSMALAVLFVFFLFGEGMPPLFTFSAVALESRLRSLHGTTNCAAALLG